MKSRTRKMLDKSVAAMLSGLEVYNKPNFEYREETFSILAINSWELLLKSRILQIDNRLSSILEFERRERSDGSFSKKIYIKKNRAGNQVTVGLFKAYDRLINDYGVSINSIVRKNLEALVEIRDNSIHFLNKDIDLKKKVHEIGTANIKNYLNLTRQWFGLDLSEYNIFLMPLSFLQDIHSANVISLNAEERNILKYINKLEKNSDDDVSNDFNLSLDIDIKLKKVVDGDMANVVISNSSEAIQINVGEEDIREKYPWDYKILTTRLEKRYENFKVNKEYHALRKKLEIINKFCNQRLLDPRNPKSAKKNFYNPNILKEFDTKYKRKKIVAG